MNCASRLSLLFALFGTAIGCLPGLPGAGGGGGGCCSPAQPACGSPCGGLAPAPAPVYAAAPLAPAPFAAYPQAPPPLPPQALFPQQQFGGGVFQPQLPVQGGYVASAQGGNFQTGAVQSGGAVAAGGAYLAEPVHQVQPLPLLGQPVAYEKTVVVAPTQEEQALNTAQVLTKVLPASAVLDEHFVEPASANNIVSSIISQTSYGDESQQGTVFNAQPAHGSSSSSSASSSASTSAEHHAAHQVRVPSASSSIEASERVLPDVVAVKQVIQTLETTPYPEQVALQTAAPYVPQPAQPKQSSYLAPETPTVQQTIVETVQPVETIETVRTAAQHVPVAVQQATQAPVAHIVPETKVVAVEDRIETPVGSDYDQPTNIATNEQATVNELLATLDTVNPTVASNLDFNQVTVEPLPNQPAIIQTEGDDYDAPLNEDRKDVPTPEPARSAVVTSAPQPVAVVPEETAPIIPQPIQQIRPVQTYQPSTAAPAVQTTVGYVEPPKQQVHLQPVAPAVRVEITTAVPAPTPAFELPVEVHEVVTPQVALQPEQATIQTITEQPVAEVTVEVLPTSAAPVSQFFENITSREETKEIPSQPEPAAAQTAAPAQVISGNDYDEEKSVENKVSTETEVVPSLAGGEYGSKFAKVQGAGTKQVSEPIEIETIENANPYGRKYWIF
ncbi:unnamed protein product [Caenorhabditis sp. 36 PRJEB53466]|nr:unnamed protein product [Caenorhabditis sp. 36 PRJEB53466]